MTPIPSSRDSRPALCLLASPPSPPAREALSAAYLQPLSSVLSRLPPSSNLVIALAAPFYPLQWPSLQSLLAGLYSLVATVQATHPTSNDANVTIVLVDHEPGRQYPPDRVVPFNDTTVLDLGTFASGPQRWGDVFHPSTEAGYELLSTFLKTAERFQTFLQKQLIAVPGGISLITRPADDDVSRTQNSDSERRHRSVVLAGTFDHFHVGHKLLIHASTLLLTLPNLKTNPQPASVIIGISGDALLTNKKYASELELWPARAQSVLDFLATILSSPLSAEDKETIGDGEEVRARFCEGRVLVRCVNISDVYGPTITEEDINAIIVSAETRSGGAAVNKKRAEQGWRELELYEIDVLSPFTEDEDGDDKDGNPAARGDFSAKISSTDIRRRIAEARTQADGRKA
jgi:phosphopantetheine adenylyltransferase